jgi:hypothetical protein
MRGADNLQWLELVHYKMDDHFYKMIWLEIQGNDVQRGG